MKKFGYFDRAKVDMQYVTMMSPFFLCDKCKKRLGVFHSMRHACFKKRGVSYVIPCKYCKYDNIRIKGALSDELDGFWENKSV